MRQDPFSLAGKAALLLACGIACGEPVRLEPVGRMLTGAGQVDSADLTNYAHALRAEANPVIFIDYVDVHILHVERFFSELDGKLVAAGDLGWRKSENVRCGHFHILWSAISLDSRLN